MGSGLVKPMQKNSPKFADISVRLRHARELLNVTVEELVQRTGIPKTRLEAFERGTAVPDPAGSDSDGSKLCNALDIGMDWLYRGDDRWVMTRATLSQKVATWQRVEQHFKEAAKKRMYEGRAASRRKPGHVREEMEKVTGLSGRTMEKAMEIVDAAKANPAKFGHLLEEMNRTNKADGVHKKLKEMQAAKPKRPRAARAAVLPTIEKSWG